MKNLLFGLAFMLMGSVAFANTPDNTVADKNQIESVKITDNGTLLDDKVLGCSSSTVTKTTTRRDGTSTVVTTTTVNCDTPAELAQYHKIMNITAN